MKRVATCLNEQQYKQLHQRIDNLGISEYEITKTLLLEFIDTGNIDVIKIKVTATKIMDAIARDLKDTKMF